QRGGVSSAGRPRGRRGRSGADLGAGGRRESGHHGDLGLDRRRTAGGRLVAVLLRPGRGGAGARPFDLAPLSQGGGAGPDPSPRPSASAATTPLCGAISRRAFLRRGQAASGTILETTRTPQVAS